MNYPETLDYLFSKLPMFQRIGAAAYRNDLNNTIALMKHLDNPENKFRSIHVAGTNGKGSTSHILAAIFASAGYKTGLFTSPHLKDFRERIKINGKMISEEKVMTFVEKNSAFIEEFQPSFFEMTTGMAFDFFAEEKVDIAIIEVGMGGRLDSTNVISPELSIITNISFDHTQFLGDTLAKIAAEKAGIIKENIPVVIGEYDEETAEVFEAFAKKLHSKIIFADKDNDTKDRLQLAKYLDLCQLKGIYQKKNILTVLSALNFFLKEQFSLSDEVIDEGFATVVDKTGLQGRWQIVNNEPLIVFDTGHNVAGIKEIISQIKTLNYSKLHFVLGVVSDKDITHILELLPKDAEYYFCRANLPRALDEKKLQEQAEIFNLKGKTYDSVLSAFENAKHNAKEDDIVLVGGSNFVVAEVL